MKIQLGLKLLILCGLLVSCSAMKTEPNWSNQIAAAIASDDRPDNQTERDAARNPAAVLAFSQIEPGDQIVDLGAGSGYFSRLLSALVGPDGKVYVQNPPLWLEKYANIRPALEVLRNDRANVSLIEANFDDLGLASGSMHAATMTLIYHDTALLDLDRAKMALEVFRVLKPGGVLLITDHFAEEGTGITMADKLHRIESSVVRSELEAAGFLFAGQSDALRFIEDDRTLNVFDPMVRGKTDRFLFRFQKPE